jgi:AraC-like DNA-binding protein
MDTIRAMDEAAGEADLCTAIAGPLRMARLDCGPGSLARHMRHSASAAAPRTYTFILQTRGRGSFAHYGHQTLLEEGDFTLCDSAAPCSYDVESASGVIMLRLPGAVLKEYLPSPEFFCGRALPCSQGFTATAAALALHLCEQIENGLSEDFRARVARHLLELISTSYAMAFESVTTASSVISGRHAKVRLHIEQHLRDPSLSPCSIAAALKLSPRYLRMIFASSNETVSAYILRRRLEECARQMADPRWRGHSISEIAFAWGFNSASHFTRSFRDRFGAAPRDYRRSRSEERAALCA